MKKSKCAGASVLCFTRTPSNKIVCLLGQDADGNQQWSDFGGGLLHWSETELRCARREFLEETCGVFRNVRITPSTPHIRFQFWDFKNRRRHYTTYLKKIPYDESVVEKFKKARRQAHERRYKCEKQKKAFLEKSQLDYIWPDDDKSSMRSYFRERWCHLSKYLDGGKLCSGLVATIPANVP